MKHFLFSILRRRKEKGTALVVVVAVIFLASIGISAALSLETNRTYLNKHSTDRAQCALLADSGVEMAKYYVRTSGNCASAASDYPCQLGPNVLFPTGTGVTSGRIEFWVENDTVGDVTGDPIVQIKAYYPDTNSRVSAGIRAAITNGGTDFTCVPGNQCNDFYFTP